ncbi:MAG: DUF1704 domain-containing protein [Sandaracinaceae bacterium]|nr:DUF1704 domain-containing protein [Sandaracinaceae bacterium]
MTAANVGRAALRTRDARQVELDDELGRVLRENRLLAFVTPVNAASERERLTEALAAGKPAEPKWELPPAVSPESRVDARRRVERLTRLAEDVPAAGMYQRRLSELALDLQLLENVGVPRRLRPIARQRYGDGREPAFAELPGGPTLRELAERLLADTPPEPEEKVVPATGRGSLAELARRAARLLDLDIRIRVEKHLVSGAAAGERTMFIADRAFGEREARRLVVHEVMGHLVAAFNGRAQPLGIFALGTGGAYADQEGMCITLEEEAGLLDSNRLRALAARVLTTDWVHEGASFAEAARRLHHDHGFSPDRAVVLCERAYRGGGVARDVVYLRSWLRVRRALRTAPRTIERMRIGKVGLDDLPELEWLARERWVDLQPPYLPGLSLARSLASTGGGTSLDTSPPNLHTSLQRFDET